MNNNEMLLLKLGEVVLKGLNRRSFEDKLVSNVRRRMKHCGSFQVYIRQSTIYVEPQTEGCDMEAAYKAARQIFGIVTVARAVPCGKTMDAVVETAKTYLADEFAKARTFKVESRRADKQFPMNSFSIKRRRCTRPTSRYTWRFGKSTPTFTPPPFPAQADCLSAWAAGR